MVKREFTDFLEVNTRTTVSFVTIRAMTDEIVQLLEANWVYDTTATSHAARMVLATSDGTVLYHIDFTFA